MGRAAVKVESIEKLAGYLERNFGDATLAAGLVETDQDQVVGRSAPNVEFMAKEVEAEHLYFPATPSFDPRPYLDAESRDSHLGVIFSTGTVSAAELMSLRSRPSRGLLSIGVVIDDFICLEKVLRETTSTRIRSAEVMGARAFSGKLQRLFGELSLTANAARFGLTPLALCLWQPLLFGSRIWD